MKQSEDNKRKIYQQASFQYTKLYGENHTKKSLAKCYNKTSSKRSHKVCIATEILS